MNLVWFISAIFKHANREVKGYSGKALLTKETIIEHLKNGNFYIGNRFREPSDLILPENIKDTYDLLINLGYTDIYSKPISFIDKDYAWGQIKLPEGWKVIKN